MDSATIRRYLQPSKTLRWHPWAPLLAGLLLLAFVFYLGATWGFSAGSRVLTRVMIDSSRADMFVTYKEAQKWPARAMVRQAGRVDAAVHSFVMEQRNPPGTFAQWRDRVEATVFFHGHPMPPQTREYAAMLAQFRLAEYSPSNPKWQVTASWCEESQSKNRGTDKNLIEDYRETASEYTQVLGRTIRPEDLAPAVPGWKCTS